MVLKLPGVQDALRYAGISIQRVPRSSETAREPLRPTKGFTVEFIGPSGIGKSTVFNRIRPGLKKNWFFEYHTRNSGLSGPVEGGATSFLASIYNARLNHLENTDLELHYKASIVRRISEVIQVELVARSKGFSRGFVLDEGISHFFVDQILDLGNTGNTDYFAGRYFIFLLPEQPGTLRNRQLQRKGALPDAGIPLSNEQRDRLRRQIDVYVALQRLYSDRGYPTLGLSAEESIEVNADKALDFIKSIEEGRI